VFRKMTKALAGAALLAPFLSGCSGPPASRDPHDAGERVSGDPGGDGEDLLGREFVRGGRAGLAKARSMDRGAMLLFVATW
jgi:hypothetical protein